MKMFRNRCVIALAAMLAMNSIAYGQANAPDGQGCTPAERSTGNLSQKLTQSNGVLCPPDIDPAMKAPTPHTGDTPVIPPPGGPRGNPNIQPK